MKISFSKNGTVEISNIDVVGGGKQGERILKNVDVKKSKHSAGFTIVDSKDDSFVFPIVDYKEALLYKDNTSLPLNVIYVTNIDSNTDLSEVGDFRKFYNCVLDDMSYKARIDSFEAPLCLRSCKIKNLKVLDSSPTVQLIDSVVGNMDIKNKEQSCIQLVDSKIESTNIERINLFAAEGNSDIGADKIEPRLFAILIGDAINLVDKFVDKSLIKIKKVNKSLEKKSVSDFSSVAEMIKWSKEE